MFKRLLPFAVLTCAVTASAQTVTYTRPSKGKTLTVFANYSLEWPFRDQVSSVYDWTAFTAVQIRIAVNTVGCGNSPELRVLGSTEPGGSYELENDSSAKTVFTPSGSRVITTYTVGNLSPYIKFAIRGLPSLGMNNCSATVTVVPFPTDQTVHVVGNYTLEDGVVVGSLNPAINGGVVLGPPSANRGGYIPAVVNATAQQVAFSRYDQNNTLQTTGGTAAPPLDVTPLVAVGSGVEVEVFNGGDLYSDPITKNYVAATSVTVENTGTVPALCAFLSVPPMGFPAPAPVSATNYTFILKASAAAKDGTGGTKTFNSIIRPYSSIRCITASGSTSIAVQQF